MKIKYMCLRIGDTLNFRTPRGTRCSFEAMEFKSTDPITPSSSWSSTPDGISYDVLLGWHENSPSNKCNNRQKEEDDPDDKHCQRHYSVECLESSKIENVPEWAQGGDPAYYHWKCEKLAPWKHRGFVLWSWTYHSEMSMPSNSIYPLGPGVCKF